MDRPDVRLWAVADGMGGHSSGEAASSLVAEKLQGLDGFDSGYAFLQAAQAALQAANAELRRRAVEAGPGQVIGTTIVALLVEEQHAACMWAGDSRGYHLAGDELRRLTRDHSLVQELVDAGVLSPSAARADSRANVITRAVGAAASLDLEMVYAPISPGDRLLLCSDGLTGVIAEVEIARSLAGGSIEAAADRLMEAALACSPTDNVSLVAIEAVLP